MGRRQRQQEAAKRAYEANYGKAPPPEEPPKRPSVWMHTVLPIAAIAVGIGGGIAWYYLKDRWNQSSLLSQRGTPRGSVAIGTRLVLIDAVSVEDNDTDSNDQPRTTTISSTRVTVLDAATGKETARKLIEGLDRCAKATDDRMWCTIENGLRIYALPDLKELLVVDKAVPGTPVPGVWHVDHDKAHQLLGDGSAALIEAATLSVTRTLAPRELEPDITGRRRPGSLTMFETSCDPVYLQQSEMMQRISKDRWVREGDHLKKGKVTTPTLLDAALISDTLVIHSSSLVPAEATLRLSRLRDDGTLAWTAELGANSCENAALTGSMYAVTTKSPDARALAIDLETGAIKWRLP